MVDAQIIREISFASLPENINRIELLLEELKAELGMSEEMEANILVSLSEAVNNAIFHGNNSNPAKKVQLKMRKDETFLTFSVLDEGSGFDLKKIIDPTSPENLNKPTGRGIFLMRNLADNIEFLEGGKKVVISFFLG
ncbi:MAG: ATP-binding protein [Chitinophagales bacterium]